MKAFIVATLLLVNLIIESHASTSSTKSQLQCKILCENETPDFQKIETNLPTKPYPKDRESRVNCYDAKLVCLSGFVCLESSLPKVTWYKQNSGGAKNPILFSCASQNKKLLEVNLPNGFFVGEGRFEISMNNNKKLESFYYKCTAGE